MHTAAERRQRKDLRFPVVLVHDPRGVVSSRDRLQVPMQLAQCVDLKVTVYSNSSGHYLH